MVTHSLDIEYIEQLKADQGLTLQQISDLSGVPVGTVKRIFAGQTDFPNAVSVAGIISALNGSLDDAFGVSNDTSIRKQKSEGSQLVQCGSSCTNIRAYEHAIESSRASFQHAYESLRESFEHQCSIFQSIIQSKDRWIKSMFLYSVAITAVCILVLIFGK